jgi:hypothetical protein
MVAGLAATIGEEGCVVGWATIEQQIPPRPGVAANRTAERELKFSPEHIQ